MKKLITLILFQLILFQFNAVSADDFGMGCDREVPSVLKYAPSGAKRLNPYTLQVNWKKGKKLFTDPVPFDAEDALWSYCGYSAKVNMHLILRIGDGDSSGELLNENTGEILPAGLGVLISPDLRYYFASSQRDGLDGWEWAVYTIDGGSVWKGYSFIEDPANKRMIYAELSEPFWNAQGKLESSYLCLSALSDHLSHKDPLPNRTKVILEEVDGFYAWAPEAKCAKAKGDE